MVRSIVKDPLFLGIPSAEATREDAAVARDLEDTLRAHQEHCVGMAANMIGVSKRIIAVCMGPMIVVMYNPVIRAKSQPYEAEEGCLSLTGVRKTTRYNRIEAEYLDAGFRRQKRVFQGKIAQIIQHETDHLNGVLI